MSAAEHGTQQQEPEHLWPDAGPLRHRQIGCQAQLLRDPVGTSFTFRGDGRERPEEPVSPSSPFPQLCGRWLMEFLSGTSDGIGCIGWANHDLELASISPAMARGPSAVPAGARWTSHAFRVARAIFGSFAPGASLQAMYRGSRSTVKRNLRRCGLQHHLALGGQARGQLRCQAPGVPGRKPGAAPAVNDKGVSRQSQETGQPLRW